VVLIGKVQGVGSSAPHGTTLDAKQPSTPREHHVSFEPGSPWTFFSEPRRLKGKREFETVAMDLQRRLRERGRKDLGRDLEQLADAITNIAGKRHDIGDIQQAVARRMLQAIAPLQRVAYYASVFLESQLFVVQERNQM
jgi:hypothetical protein